MSPTVHDEREASFRTLWEKSPSVLKKLAPLETRVDHEFRDRTLLFEAMTHRSAISQGSAPGFLWNERLEFLGDAVLGLCMSVLLLSGAERNEGDLSKIRAALVNEETLATIARRISLGEALLLGRGEDRCGGRDKSSLLAGGLEALLGAVFLDAGFETSLDVIRTLFEPELAGAVGPLTSRDFKTMLQELTQQRFHAVPVYRVVEESGPDHAKQFALEVEVDGRVVGRGQGVSKKRASQLAAEAALVLLSGENGAAVAPVKKPRRNKVRASVKPRRKSP